MVNHHTVADGRARMDVHREGLRRARLQHERRAPLRGLRGPPQRVRRAVRLQRVEALEEKKGRQQAVRRGIDRVHFEQVRHNRAEQGWRAQRAREHLRHVAARELGSGGCGWRGGRGGRGGR